MKNTFRTHGYFHVRCSNKNFRDTYFEFPYWPFLTFMKADSSIMMDDTFFSGRSCTWACSFRGCAITYLISRCITRIFEWTSECNEGQPSQMARILQRTTTRIKVAMLPFNLIYPLGPPPIATSRSSHLIYGRQKRTFAVKLAVWSATRSVWQIVQINTFFDPSFVWSKWPSPSAKWSKNRWIVGNKTVTVSMTRSVSVTGIVFKLFELMLGAKRDKLACLSSRVHLIKGAVVLTAMQRVAKRVDTLCCSWPWLFSDATHSSSLLKGLRHYLKR